MFVVQLDKGINLLIKFFYIIGFWHHDDDPTLTQIAVKIFYSVYYSLFPISLIAGAIKSDDPAESVSLLAIAFSNVTLVVKIYYIIWKKKEILGMIKRIGVYSVDDHETFALINDKLKTFMKFFTAFAFSAALAAFCSIIVHVGYLGRERRLFFNIGFPFDYKNYEVAFWLALTFNSSEEIVAVIIIFFSTIIWYLMINCAFQYEVLGMKLRTMGVIKTDDDAVLKRKVLEKNRNLFSRNLMFGCLSFRDITEYSCHLSFDQLLNLYIFVTAQQIR